MSTNPVIQLFHSISPLTNEAVMDFEKIISYDKIPKKTTLLEIGKYAKSMYYIKSGLARSFYFHDGKDVTDFFATEGQLIGTVSSLMNGLPSHKGIQLIEDSEIFYFSSAAFETLCSRYHDLEHTARKLISLALVEEQQRIESFRFYSMKERYELMGKKYQGIMNRCPLHYIASYLGTTQVSISRIRAGVQ